MAASTVARAAAPTETTSRPIKSWQSVESCLPELGAPACLAARASDEGLAAPRITESPVVLVYGETCGSRTAFLRHDPAYGETSWLTTDSEEWDITSQVTHWMPLPAVPKVAAAKASAGKAKAKRSTLAERATELAKTETPADRTAARKASAQRQVAKGTATKDPVTKTVRAGKSGRVSVTEPAPAAAPAAVHEAAAGA